MKRGTAVGTAVILLAGGLSAASARVAAAAWDSQATATATFGVGTFAGPVPQIVKSFEPNVQTAGQPVRMTLTIYNSSPPQNRYIGSFADNPPSGMQIASPANAVTNCPGGSNANAISGPGNALNFAIELSTATVSCTVSVNMTGVAGTYVNGAANISQYLVSGMTTLPVTGATVTFH